jgi:hypothetical protein
VYRAGYLIFAREGRARLQRACAYSVEDRVYQIQAHKQGKASNLVKQDPIVLKFVKEVRTAEEGNMVFSLWCILEALADWKAEKQFVMRH